MGYSKRAAPAKEAEIARLQTIVLTLEHKLALALEAISRLEGRVQELEDARSKHDQLFRLMQSHSDSKDLELANFKLKLQLSQEPSPRPKQDLAPLQLLSQKVGRLHSQLDSVRKEAQQGKAVSRTERRKMLGLISQLADRMEQVVARVKGEDSSERVRSREREAIFSRRQANRQQNLNSPKAF